MKGIKFYEPWFFIFFGLFHLHRVWGIVDRNSYANFWLNTMLQKGTFYYLLMGILAGFCICGIVTFFKNQKYWWRTIYIFGGGYVLFDLFAIATGLKFWNKFLLKMFDVSSPYWNILWLSFIVMGMASFILGINLLHQRKVY